MSATVSISHPTDRPNFSQVHLGEVTIVFSYRTPIAVYGPEGSAVRENEWGPTTGRHLTECDGGNIEAKAKRVDGKTFAEVLDLNLTTIGAEVLA